MKIQDFPFELLTQIFQYLSFSDQLVCQSICKNWSRPSLSCFNTTIDVFVEVMAFNKLVGKLGGEVNSSSSSADNFSGNVVRKLKLRKCQGERYYDYLWKNDFINLLDSCPNLNSIEFVGEEDNILKNCLKEMDESGLIMKNLQYIQLQTAFYQRSFCYIIMTVLKYFTVL
jgi:hypothetical protein